MPLPKVGTDSPEGPLPVFRCLSVLGSKVLEMGEAENCPNPKEPLSGIPTVQIERWEMIVLWGLYTAMVFV